MTEEFRFELRFSLLMVGLIAGYAAAVTVFAATHDSLDALQSLTLKPLMFEVLGGTLLLLFLGYLARQAWLSRRGGLWARLHADLHRHVLKSDKVTARLTVLAGWFAMTAIFEAFKPMIGQTRGFPFDPALIHADRLLFFGHDAWQATHFLFGGPFATAALQFCYTVWFLFTWLSLVYCIVGSDRVRVRMQYLLAFTLNWVLVGSLAAYVFASAGPCFYQPLFHDPHFAPLMQRLHLLNAEIVHSAPAFRLLSLDAQQWLWNNFTSGGDALGAGISAMPSMHVALATTMARGAFAVDRRSGVFMSIYAALIFIGSIHFGWHYATGAIAGAGMALGVWWLSGAILARTVFAAVPETEHPAAGAIA